MSFLEMEGHIRRFGIVQDEVVDDELAVEPEAVHGSDVADLIVAGFVGSKKSRPARGKILHSGRRRNRRALGMKELQVDGFVDAHNLRSAFEFGLEKYSPVRPGCPSAVERTVDGMTFLAAGSSCPEYR